MSSNRLWHRSPATAVAGMFVLAARLAVAEGFQNPGPETNAQPAGNYLESAEWGGSGETDTSSCPQYGDFQSCQCSSSWTITADALWLNREPPAGYTVLSDLNTGEELLNASQMGLGTHAGPRLILLRELASGWVLDLEYFGIDGWSTTENFGPGEYLLRGDASNSGPDGTSESLLYASRLRTAEINLRAPGLGWLKPLAGFRWVGLSETYQANGAFDGGGVDVPYTLRYETDNNLYGGQIGAAASLWDGEVFTLNAIGKAGLFLADNQNSGSFRATFGPGPNDSVSFDGIGHGRRAAFFGELGIVLGWRLNNHIAVRGGYQVFWLTDVALAIQQPLSTDVANGTGGYNTSDLFMHGPSAGLEFSW